MSGESRDIQWGSEPEGYGIGEGEVEGMGIGLFATAVQVWCLQNEDKNTVLDAALAFRCSEKSVREAVEYHPWMFLGALAANGSEEIEHEGE